ncbi:MAG TPA: hypothetical protein PKY29_10320 [Ferruginibacter sp.]|mgnify:CR=1 FL=1|nr:hypothetical protein [Ferruginibacter sp.]HRO17617.1 hypothetical protein [Ferruginibacter sp.]HRQ21702.1 hypothetical protein [Ferruginibacter sp.]
MKGIQRFEHYLNEIESKLHALKSDTPVGEQMLHSNIRTPFFMLESLARIYGSISNNPWFDKLKDQSKAVEDAIGVADHYVMGYATLSTVPDIPTDVLESVKQHIPEAYHALESLMSEKNWLNGKRIKKIRKKLTQVEWLKEKKEIQALYQFFEKEMDETIAFYQQNPVFTDMENHVHELRRKLRWISIYATALRGAVQLTETGHIDPALEKYQTATIVTSPYNQLPEEGDHKYVLLFDKKRFYALSWMIAELGNIKDLGLLNEMIEESGHTHHEGWNPPEKMNEALLGKATEICKCFFEENHLAQLIYGIGKN